MNPLDALRQRLQAVRKACAEIGRIPPRPAGVRAAVGGIAVAVLQRLTFWYTPAVQHAIGTLTDVVEDSLGELERMGQQGEQDRARMSAMETRLAEMQAALEGLRDLHLGLMEKDRAQACALADALGTRIAEQARALELERATTIRLEGDLREQTEAVQELAEERRRKEEEIEARLGEWSERLQLLRRETLDQAQRLAWLQAGSTEPRASASGPGAPEHPAGWEALEAALEGEIRGTRGEVQARWKGYLPLMPREGRVLDLHCGRGEWLELLREAGIAARGVEANGLMAAECRERFLDAEQAQPLEYLARMADGSLAAVTVLRRLEHLPFPELVRLIDEVARVLAPGGLAIFETPNAANVLAGGGEFYKDPGRVRPLPSETLRAVVASRGLEPVEVRFGNPAAEEERIPEEGEGAVARRLNRYFYGPRDYAVVSRKR